MGWRFRKSFSPIPGVRLTISPSGLSTSVGVGPVRLTHGPRGSAVSTSLLGTGLSYRQPLSTPPAGSIEPDTGGAVLAPPELAPSPVAAIPTMAEIRSASSAVLTSAGLAAFKQSLADAQTQYASIEAGLEGARRTEQIKVTLHDRWANGWLFRHMRKARFAQIREDAETATAMRQELEQQLDLSKLDTQFDMPDGVAKAFAGFCDAFKSCAGSQCIWDYVSARSADQVAERTAANRVVDRKPVSFALGKCGIIDTPMSVPCLQNANGGDLYFYPGFLVYLAAATNYALIEYGELQLHVTRTRFLEVENLPKDAQQIGTTWAKTNKDGSPDRRFRDNYQIPVMEYAQIALRTPAGLNEEYVLSNVVATEGFGQAWDALREAIQRGV